MSLQRTCSLCRGAKVIFGAASMEDRTGSSEIRTILCPMCLGSGSVAQQLANREAVVIRGVVCRSGLYQDQTYAVGSIVGEVPTEVRESVAAIRRDCGLDTVRASRELTDYMSGANPPA